MTDLSKTVNLHDIIDDQRLQIQTLQSTLSTYEQTINRARRIISKADVVIVSVEDALRKGYVLPVAADVIKRAIDAYNEA